MNDRRSVFQITTIVSAVALLIIVTAAFSGGLLLAPYVSDDAQAAAAAPQTERTALTPAQQAEVANVLAAYELAFVGLYQDTLPSVVEVRVTKAIDQNLLERFGFGRPDPDEDDPENSPEEDSEEDPDLPDFFNQGGGSGFI